MGEGSQCLVLTISKHETTKYNEPNVCMYIARWMNGGGFSMASPQ
jgi:hypothetical protein